MASSSASFCGVIAPILTKRITYGSLQVRAQSFRDEGVPSNNIVDTNLSVLKKRIEEIKTKERLERCSRSANGWNYVPGYDYKPKREANLSEFFQLLGLVGGTIGLTTLSGTFLLFLVSLLVHLNQ